jgi:ligand-binding SRPBCC domain-containing protein
MPVIHLTTFIEAPPQRVFDLSRSIDLHKKSMEATKEEVIGGRTSGLVDKGETITWQARHLGKKRQLKIMITQMEPYRMFADEMAGGDFKSMRHEHHFKEVANGTIMIDLFHFTAPFGILGKMAAWLFLTRYMTRLLQKRNQVIKTVAESEQWKQFLTTQP